MSSSNLLTARSLAVTLKRFLIHARVVVNVCDVNKILCEPFVPWAPVHIHGYGRRSRWRNSEHSRSMTGLRTI